MNSYRTIFISDTHLGGPCNHSALIQFLENNNADVWYLVGDWLDFWAKGWKPEDSQIVQMFFAKAEAGAIIYVLPGNHDEVLRGFEGVELGNIVVQDKAIFTSLLGETFLVIHGDLFDAIIGHATWLAKLGALGYNTLVAINHSLNFFRKLFHLPYWSFSAAIKKAVKAAVSYISDFKQSLVEVAKTHGTNGVICGHIHTPEDTLDFGGIHYINCGDWVESLSVLVEHDDGTLELMYYDKH